MYEFENNVDSEIIKLLLRCNASIKEKDLDGKTTLMYATEYNNIEIFEKLLKKVLI